MFETGGSQPIRRYHIVGQENFILWSKSIQILGFLVSTSEFTQMLLSPSLSFLDYFYKDF